VTSSPVAEEAVAEMLTQHFGKPATSYTDLESGFSTVSLFFEEKPPFSIGKRQSLRKALARLKKYGLDPKPATISLKKLRSQDWAESWKLHFKPLEIGGSLLVKPSWSRQQAKKDQAVVMLDPGLSFGTGQHPTTSFCLRQVAALSRCGRERSFLDIGTGSGILAIAAAKLGYAPVVAFDHDPQAIRIAQQNARRNRVLHKIDLFEQDVTKLSRRSGWKYYLVCANLISNVLIQ